MIDAAIVLRPIILFIYSEVVYDFACTCLFQQDRSQHVQRLWVARIFLELRIYRTVVCLGQGIIIVCKLSVKAAAFQNELFLAIELELCIALGAPTVADCQGVRSTGVGLKY